MFSEIHPFGSKQSPQEKNEAKVKSLTNSLTGVKRTISQLKGEDQIGPKIIQPAGRFSLQPVINKIKEWSIKVLEFRQGLLEEKITKLTQKTGIIHSGPELSSKSENEVRRKQIEEQVLFATNVIKKLEPQIKHTESLTEKRTQEIKANCIGPDDSVYNSLNDGNLVAEELATLVKDLLKGDMLTPTAVKRLKELDEDYDNGGTNYGTQDIASEIKDLYTDGRFFSEDLSSRLATDPKLVEAKKQLEDATTAMKKATDSLVQLSSSLTAADCRALSLPVLRLLLTHTTPAQLTALSGTVMKQATKDEQSIKAREKEIELQVKQKLDPDTAEDTVKGAVLHAIIHDNVLSAWKKQLEDGNRILPALHEAAFERAKGNVGERSSLLSACSVEQLTTLAATAKKAVDARQKEIEVENKKLGANADLLAALEMLKGNEDPSQEDVEKIIGLILKSPHFSKDTKNYFESILDTFGEGIVGIEVRQRIANAIVEGDKALEPVKSTIRALEAKLVSENGLLLEITSMAVDRAGQKAVGLVDEKVGDKEVVGGLKNLPSADRIALKKELANGINELTEQLKLAHFTQAQRAVLQQKLDRLEGVSKVLVGVMKEHANKHLLDVMKGKAEASELYPGFTVEEMQDALLTANIALLPTKELLGIIQAEVRNPAASIEDKKKLLQFLATWCARNYATNEYKKNSDVVTALLVEAGALTDTDGKRLFTNECFAIREALKPTVSAPQVKYAGDSNFQNDIVKKLLENRFGNEQSYKSAVQSVANDLLLLALDDYLPLTADDLFFPKWEKKENELNPASPADRKLVGNFNRMSNYVAALFVIYPSPEDRARLIKFFINVAMELKKEGHIFPLMAVFGGLTNTGVLKMQTAQKMLKGYEAELNELNTLTNPAGGNANLFKFMEKRAAEGLESLPHLGATKPRILKTFEGNPSLDPDREVYNFGKYRFIKNEIDQFLHAQESLKKIPQEAKTSLAHEIRSHKMLGDEDFDARVKDLRGQKKEFRDEE